MTELLAKNVMTKDVVTVDLPSGRDDVLRILKRTGVSGVAVTQKDKQLLGIVTRKDILRHPDETQIALLMSRNPVIVTPETTIQEVISLILEKNVRRLPVVDNGKVVGIVSVSDIIKVIAKQHDTSEIRNGFLSKSTFSVWEETPLPVVGRIMELAEVDAVPILNSDNVLTGIISERDLIRLSHVEDDIQTSDFSTGTDDDEWTWESIRDNHTITYGVSKVELPDRPVKDGMIKKVLAVPRNAEVSDCALKMKRAKIDQMPVIDNDGRLCGMLFDRMLLKALLE
ncbi:MAG TPA: CBS domain-containing protein [Methanocorpusculum sp.]|nr:CBS domain-containing protein [Methanocorpusculum sp.]HJJ44747.1 CBS domain-containing protein [Methanocorpusculum sp.]HJJ59996.1 CBS domain-containing protein [Methanocorpusculum sp.]